MKIRIYEYSKCSTCRKALKFLDRRGVDYAKVPIVETPPALAELKAALAALGGDVRRLFNTSGELYREMRLSERLKAMSEAEALGLLAKHGKLVKRPFVPEPPLAGFDEARWKAAFPRS